MADSDFSTSLEGSDLAFALIESSQAAALLLNGNLVVVAASGSFYRAFKMDAAQVIGRMATDIGDGEWAVPQLRSLLNATASGSAAIDAYEMDLKGELGTRRRLVLHAQKLDYGLADAPVRLLLTVTDVTAARSVEKLKDELLLDKAAALQEVEHRVANSLQIIASVILQSAKKVQSKDGKDRLRDAHNRVMSVAALQQQLATSQIGEVALRPYFAQLCESLGASMIQDHALVTLTVDIDDSVVDASVSVSLGLLVTELAINSLKHAFPKGRKGAIVVAYRAEPTDWVLCVRDDGVGMPADPAKAKPGLGTSIVQALAKQLRCTVEVVDNRPGTKVSIIHAAAERLPLQPAV